MQCPNPERCGSCGWSHIPYEKQLKQKLSDINGSFAIKKLDLHVDEILASPITHHYRNRMDFVIDWQGNVGLREKGKWWSVIDNHPCFIADQKIEDHFFLARQWAKTCGLSFYDRKANVGFLRYAVIRSTSLGETMVIIVTSAPKDADEEASAKKALESLAGSSKPTTLVWSINHTISDVSFGDELRVISGPGVIEETIAGYHYKISPNAFFQTNPKGAEMLLDTVREFATTTPGPASDTTLLDLYCGTGFFAVALAPSFKRTIGVEMVPEAIKDARVNAELNGATVEFHDAKTEDFDWKSLGAEVVILDPPRGGMVDKALQDVIKARPTTIVYVSCNYKNFAREMVILQAYYSVEAIRAIDMFPHTPHVELVIKLVRHPSDPTALDPASDTGEPSVTKKKETAD
ncbi:MAG: 23S rRNA (uracil(1939)-C(5))-methyltransferase RlmD [Patescibacteria group bacterium]|jgi:23S rRNA (uracil-5-)-methyltransferase RumA